MSCYSTSWVTFRLWHPILFRCQAWFLSNQPAPLPLTPPIGEPAYYTSRTGQTELDHGQISAWGNFNEGRKKSMWYKNSAERFCSRQFCLVQVEWSHLIRVLKLSAISGMIPTPALYKWWIWSPKFKWLVQGHTIGSKAAAKTLVSNSQARPPSTTLYYHWEV